jgi:hypothetical protein
MNKIFLWLCLSAWVGAPVWAQAPSRPSLYDLCRQFNEEIDEAKKRAALEQITKTPPSEARDVRAIFDLFMRYSDDSLRRGVLSSLDAISPSAESLAPVFFSMLQDSEPESVLFGIRGSLKLRSVAALPEIEKLAKRKFEAKDPAELSSLAKRNAWWTHYEALYSLAQWKGAPVFELVLKKTRETPKAARILAILYWKKALPEIARWATGTAEDKDKAAEALSAVVPTPLLREARVDMDKILRDPKAERELRHQIAVKIGLSSTDEEVEALSKDYEASSDTGTRVMIAAAVFSSRSLKAVPLLMAYAKTNSDPVLRLGARSELKELLPTEQYLSLLEWAAASDPDSDNRKAAAVELK